MSSHVHRNEVEEDDEDDNDDHHEARVNSVAFAPNGQSLSSGGDEGDIFLRDAQNFL